MFQNKSTYRQISLALLMLFMSFIITPTLMVTCIDEDADISMVFALVEEETKESNEKSGMDNDEVFQKAIFPDLISISLDKKLHAAFFTKNLSNLYCPGEVAPPPELS